jgi:hypothetical protein
VDVFQGQPSNSVPLCLTSWKNQKKSAKTSEKIVDLQKSGSSLGTISKLFPRDECHLVQKVQINPSTTAKAVQKYLYPQ